MDLRNPRGVNQGCVLYEDRTYDDSLDVMLPRASNGVREPNVSTVEQDEKLGRRSEKCLVVTEEGQTGWETSSESDSEVIGKHMRHTILDVDGEDHGMTDKSDASSSITLEENDHDDDGTNAARFDGTEEESASSPLARASRAMMMGGEATKSHAGFNFKVGQEPMATIHEPGPMGRKERPSRLVCDGKRQECLGLNQPPTYERSLRQDQRRQKRQSRTMEMAMTQTRRLRPKAESSGGSVSPRSPKLEDPDSDSVEDASLSEPCNGCYEMVGKGNGHDREGRSLHAQRVVGRKANIFMPHSDTVVAPSFALPSTFVSLGEGSAMKIKINSEPRRSMAPTWKAFIGTELSASNAGLFPAACPRDPSNASSQECASPERCKPSINTIDNSREVTRRNDGGHESEEVCNGDDLSIHESHKMMLFGMPPMRQAPRHAQHAQHSQYSQQQQQQQQQQHHPRRNDRGEHQQQNRQEALREIAPAPQETSWTRIRIRHTNESDNGISQGLCRDTRQSITSNGALKTGTRRGEEGQVAGAAGGGRSLARSGAIAEAAPDDDDDHNAVRQYSVSKNSCEDQQAAAIASSRPNLTSSRPNLASSRTNLASSRPNRRGDQKQQRPPAVDMEDERSSCGPQLSLTGGCDAQRITAKTQRNRESDESSIVSMEIYGTGMTLPWRERKRTGSILGNS